jgi:predicted MPP superfamily phosphohydrolase
MMKLAVSILFLVALLADVYLYRSVVCQYFRKLPARIAYIILALVTDGMALSALLLYSFAAVHGSSDVMTVMWLVWIFFLITLPKLLYCAGSFLDFLARLLFRRRVTIFRWLTFCISVVAVVAMIYGATIGRTRLRVEEVVVSSDKIPATFDGYRIAQFSDVHVGTMPNAAGRIARIAKKIDELAVDMVVNTGDLINIDRTELTPEVIQALSEITAPDGVWSVWGNHDLGFYIRGADSLLLAENHKIISDGIREAGWRILSDKSVYVRRGADSILLSGVDYPTMKLNGYNNSLGGADLGKTFAGIEGDPFNVVLSHTPQLWGEITATGHGDLTLSGHTHAMQMKFPFFGRLLSPASYMYGEWSGAYRDDNKKNNMLYVNDGIGCVGYPMRIGTRPEVTLFILKRCE